MFCAATFTRTAVVLLVCCLVVTSAAQAQNFTDIKPSAAADGMARPRVWRHHSLWPEYVYGSRMG